MSRETDDTNMVDANSGDLTDHGRKLLAAYENASGHIKATISSMLRLDFDEDLRPGSSTERKRQHESEDDEERLEKRARTLGVPPEARSMDFLQIQNPKKDYDCFIQVNNLEIHGSIAGILEGHGVKIFIDAGRSAKPSIGLSFRYPGSEGNQVGKVHWEIGARVGNQWVVQYFNYVLPKDVPRDIAVNHKDVIAACSGDVFLRLVCITLVLTVQGQGYRRRDMGTMSDRFRTTINTIFSPKQGYTLRIWFLMPVQFPDMDTKCLSVLRYLFCQREEPFCNAPDKNGVYLADLLQPSRGNGNPQDTIEATQPLDAGIEDKSAPKQDPKPATPTFATDGGRVEHYRDRHANVPVPSFGFSLPILDQPPRPNINHKTSRTVTYPPKPSKSDDEEEEGELQDSEENPTAASQPSHEPMILPPSTPIRRSDGTDASPRPNPQLHDTEGEEMSDINDGGEGKEAKEQEDGQKEHEEEEEGEDEEGGGSALDQSNPRAGGFVSRFLSRKRDKSAFKLFAGDSEDDD